MTDLATAESWKEHVNRQLGPAIRSNKYVSIKVLILYWQEGNEGFKTEGHEFGLMLGETFNYAIEEFPIPSSKSELQLHHEVTRILLELATTSEEHNASSLLIIHYGGHGDKNDAFNSGEEKRAVWAAHEKGSPTLEWFRIQESLKEADSDVLLLLDCCFAAQAGRARESSKSRFEILAAAAMGVKTPMPGEKSFTRALQKQMEEILAETGGVIMPDLHQRLLDRKARLFATPIYISFVRERRPIRLEPLSRLSLPTAAGTTALDALECSFFQLGVQTRDNLNLSNLEEIVRWLSENAPPMIEMIYVEKVVGRTNHIQNVVGDMQQKDQPLMRALEKPAVEEILSRWENVKAIAHRLFNQEKTSTGNDANITVFWQQVGNILSQLDEGNSAFVESLEWNILNSQTPSEHDTILQEVIDNPAVKSLGIADQLRLRQIICSSSLQSQEFTQTGDEEMTADNPDVLHEFKIYGPYINPADFPDLTDRVQRLAELLGAPKNPGFRALRCQRWYRIAVEDRYVLEFEIPPSYTVRSGYNTLQSAIRDTKGVERPTLNQRFRIGLMLACAVQKWHSVGWVHQGISGPNIIFLTSKESGKVDYDGPFLQGFEFSRPDSDPSIGRPTDDIIFNVYRHPARQGNARKGHRKIHDIYSLGVVLLEIGLWQCAADMVYPSRKKPIPSGAEMQKKLLSAARDRLGHYMGQSYKDAVETCLAARFDVNMDDENASKLARMFQKKVINSISQGIRVHKL